MKKLKLLMALGMMLLGVTMNPVSAEKVSAKMNPVSVNAGKEPAKWLGFMSEAGQVSAGKETGHKAKMKKTATPRETLEDLYVMMGNLYDMLHDDIGDATAAEELRGTLLTIQPLLMDASTPDEQLSSAIPTAQAAIDNALHIVGPWIIETIRGEVISILDDNAIGEEDAVCLQIIADGKAAANALVVTWDYSKSYDANLLAVQTAFQGVVVQTVNDLEYQRHPETVLSEYISQLTWLYGVMDELGETAAATALQNEINAAQAVLDNASSTLQDKRDAIDAAKTAINTYLPTVVPPMIAAMKATFLESLDDLLDPGDSEACQQIIANAKTAVNAVEFSWDYEKSVMDNQMAMQMLFVPIQYAAETDLAAQRASEAEPEIYAAMVGTKMVLYYDDQKSSRANVIAGWIPEQGTNNMTDEERAAITSVELDASMQAARPTKMEWWFAKLSNVTSIIHLDYLNTSEVTSMYSMFYECTSLTSLDLSHFNTSKVQKMGQLFLDCNSLTELNLSSFNTSNVTEMLNMFGSCSSLTTLDLSHFNTAKVTMMTQMFDGCSSLTTIYCNDEWNPSTSGHMFAGCTSLVGGKGTAYDAAHKDAAYARPDKGASEPGYFTSTAALPEIYAAMDGTKMVLYYDDQKASRENLIAGWIPEQGTNNMTDEERAAITSVELDASMQEAQPTNMEWWVAKLSNVTSIIHLDYLNTSEVTSMYSMFYECTSLTSLDLSHFNTSKVQKMGQLFLDCNSLTELNLSSFNTSNVTEMLNMFGSCSSLTTLDLSHFNTAKVTMMTQMFDGCSSLTTIYCNDEWNPSTSGHMFAGCTSLVGGKGTVYDPGHVNAAYARPDKTGQAGYFTSTETEPEIYAVADGTKMVLYYDDQKESRANVITGWEIGTGALHMTGEERAAITSVELDASMQEARPTRTYYWFFGMTNMTGIVHLDYLNTSAVTNMSGMFDDCEALTSLDVSHFNTANVTDISNMFAFCSSLTSLDVSHFNTSNVTEMQNVFNGCRTLKTLDVSNFDMSNVWSIYAMFNNCPNLETIYCNDDWSAINESEVFNNCTKLVGGKGTTYDAAHIDAAYARPDKTGQAGYFTLSPEKAVEDLIDAIGEVEYTAESKAKIDEARAGYDALTKAQKEKVSNYDVLKAAEALYLALKMEAEYAEAIAEVEGECEYTINLVTPGTFAIAMVEAMGDHTWVDVHHLCVSGPMNDDDLSYLAQCVNMVTLSLRNAQFETYGASRNWKSLEKILLPPTCKTLKKEAFYHCDKLEYINLGEVETFGEQAFMYCAMLTDVDLHSAKTLDHRVFEYCTGLTTVNMPEVTYIGTQCFVGCSNLVSASMPKATTIGGSAFGYLTKLKQVELCDDIEKFEGSTFYDCTALLSVKLPSKLRYIGSNTFKDITEVEGEWPKGIEFIGSGNFAKMDYMVIGPNVTQIWVASNKWQNIYCYAADPQAVVSKYNPFTASNVGNTTLYVPRSSLSAYKLNQAYANFLHIYALDDDIDLLHIYSPYTMLSTERITEDAQLILHSEAALKTSAPSPLKVGSYEQYIHLGPKQYTSQTVTEDGVQVTHYYSYLHHTGILHANSPLSSDEVTVHLIPMHKQWNFITLPFDVSVQDISIWARGTGNKEDGVPGVSQYVFREYSGANRASGSGATWVNVPEDGVLQANKGYILYWAVEGGTSQTNYYPGTLSDEFIYYFRMPAMHTENHSNIFATGDVQVPLTHYSSEFPQNVSWNLVGNPYPCMYDIRQTDFDATMTMWNGTAYVAYSPIDDPYTLRPGEAFFVQAPDEVDAITFHEEGRYDATKIEIDQNAYQLHMMPTRTRVAGGRTLYNFLLSDSAYSDRARLVVNPQASAEYDVHRDAAKMLSTDAGVPQLWIEEDGVRYAINECPAQDSYRMGAFIASDGAYHISLVSEDSENTVWLTDLANGTVTDLTQGAYSFTSAAGMYAGRFIVTFGANAPTRVENGEDGAMQGKKMLIDGQLIIITPQGKRFNANGVEL